MNGQFINFLLILRCSMIWKYFFAGICKLLQRHNLIFDLDNSNFYEVKYYQPHLKIN